MHLAGRRLPSLWRCSVPTTDASAWANAGLQGSLHLPPVGPGPSGCMQQIQGEGFQQQHRAIHTSSAAHQQLGTTLSLVLDSLGARVWEAGHSLAHLPWWASIPVTTLALRGLLLPLSVRAKAASINVVLLNTAFSQARLFAQSVKPTEARALGYIALIRAIYCLLRARHQPPGFKWYIANMSIQAAVFGLLTSSLNTMSASVWPGLDDQGLLYFKDLTSPPVFLETLSTPYGTAGAVLPLGLVLLYTRAVQSSLAVRGASGLHTAAQLMLVPFYCLSLIQPHATLLYWSSSLAAHLALQASPMGRPPLLLPHQPQPLKPQAAFQSKEPTSSSSQEPGTQAGDARKVNPKSMAEAAQAEASSGVASGDNNGDGRKADSGGGVSQLQSQEQQGEVDPLQTLQQPIMQDRELLVGLGEYYAARGKREAAAVCYARATVLTQTAGDGPARKQALQNLKQGLQQVQAEGL